MTGDKKNALLEIAKLLKRVDLIPDVNIQPLDAAPLRVNVSNPKKTPYTPIDNHQCMLYEDNETYVKLSANDS